MKKFILMLTLICIMPFSMAVCEQFSLQFDKSQALIDPSTGIKVYTDHVENPDLFPSSLYLEGVEGQKLRTNENIRWEWPSAFSYDYYFHVPGYSAPWNVVEDDSVSTFVGNLIRCDAGDPAPIEFKFDCVEGQGCGFGPQETSYSSNLDTSTGVPPGSDPTPASSGSSDVDLSACTMYSASANSAETFNSQLNMNTMKEYDGSIWFRGLEGRLIYASGPFKYEGNSNWVVFATMGQDAAFSTAPSATTNLEIYECPSSFDVSAFNEPAVNMACDGTCPSEPEESTVPITPTSTPNTTTTGGGTGTGTTGTGTTGGGTGTGTTGTGTTGSGTGTGTTGTGTTGGGTGTGTTGTGTGTTGSGTGTTTGGSGSGTTTGTSGSTVTPTTTSGSTGSGSADTTKTETVDVGSKPTETTTPTKSPMSDNTKYIGMGLVAVFAYYFFKKKNA